MTKFISNASKRRFQNLKTHAKPIKNLDELLAALQENDPRLPQHNDPALAHHSCTTHFRFGSTDWSSLPTFGGQAPDDCSEVWSWDADRVLVGTCSDDARITDRDAEAWLHL